MALKFVDRRGVLAGLAAMALMPAASPAQRRSGRAIVIGAGVAGLACARDMMRAGLDVVVLEAQARIGGRLKTSHQWEGLPVELGASWIYGVTGNPAASIARSAGLDLQPVDFANRAVYEAGSGPLGPRSVSMRPVRASIKGPSLRSIPSSNMNSARISNISRAVSGPRARPCPAAMPG